MRSTTPRAAPDPTQLPPTGTRHPGRQRRDARGVRPRAVHARPEAPATAGPRPDAGRGDLGRERPDRARALRRHVRRLIPERPVRADPASRPSSPPRAARAGPRSDSPLRRRHEPLRAYIASPGRSSPRPGFRSHFAESLRISTPWFAERTPAFSKGLPQTQAAISYAQRMHAGQRQGDGTPFINHPLEVGALLQRAGAADHLIAAGVMHDLIEKTDASTSDLRSAIRPANHRARARRQRRRPDHRLREA